MTPEPYSEPPATASTRICVVPDLDDELVAALGRLEEILITLSVWEDDESDDVDLPGALAGGHALAAVRRLWDVLSPTQSRTNGGRDELLGPRLFGPGGRYEHMPLRFVHVDRQDLATLAATAAALGRAVAADADIAGAVAEYLHAGEKPADVVAEAARIHGLLDLHWTPEANLLYDRITAAGEADTILTVEEEAAYQRTADRLNAMWAHGSGIDRFLY